MCFASLTNTFFFFDVLSFAGWREREREEEEEEEEKKEKEQGNSPADVSWAWACQFSYLGPLIRSQ